MTEREGGREKNKKKKRKEKEGEKWGREEKSRDAKKPKLKSRKS